MSYARLRAFHAVATHGSVTAAARALHLTQPAVTHQLTALERERQVELFHRKGRGLALTETGALLLNLTRAFFDLERQTEDLLAAAAGLRGGFLNIGADGPFHVMSPLKRFVRAHPEVRVTVALGNSSELLRKLLAFEADVGVFATFEPHPDLKAREIGRHPVALAVRAGHPWAERGRVHVRELEGCVMVDRERGSATRAAFREALAALGVEPRYALELPTREAVLEAVAEGIGAAAVSAAEFGHDERIRRVDLSGTDVETREFVVFRRERARVPAIAAFVDACVTSS